METKTEKKEIFDLSHFGSIFIAEQGKLLETEEIKPFT